MGKGELGYVAQFKDFHVHTPQLGDQWRNWVLLIVVLQYILQSYRGRYGCHRYSVHMSYAVCHRYGIHRYFHYFSTNSCLIVRAVPSKAERDLRTISGNLYPGILGSSRCGFNITWDLVLLTD